MDQKREYSFYLGVVVFPLCFVFILWLVFWFEVTFGYDFNRWGILPRTFSGLKGIFFSPFIHSTLSHLYNNSLPLLVLGACLFYFYREIRWKVVLWGILLSGFFTWLIARQAYHIGASGVIYVWVSFIFFKGIFSRHFRLVALSLLVVFVYGSMMWYLFPIEERISWEGHLAGFVTGFILALVLKKGVPKKEKYAWESEDYDEKEDAFLRHFDEDGNFIETRDFEKSENEEKLKIRYHYKPDKPPND